MDKQHLVQEVQKTCGAQVMWVYVTWQKLCPQGVETGSSNRSRQMEHVNSCSENSSGAAASAIIILLLLEDREETAANC